MVEEYTPDLALVTTYVHIGTYPPHTHIYIQHIHTHAYQKKKSQLWWHALEILALERESQVDRLSEAVSSRSW